MNNKINPLLDFLNVFSLTLICGAIGVMFTFYIKHVCDFTLSQMKGDDIYERLIRRIINSPGYKFVFRVCGVLLLLLFLLMIYVSYIKILWRPTR